MFNDLIAFVMNWRVNGGTTKYPPEAEMMNYLNERGWKAERGGNVSIRTVQEMIRNMDPNLDALPPAGLERVARIDFEILPGTEAMCVGYSPEFWMEYRDAVMNGWKPAWQRAVEEEREGTSEGSSE